MTFQLWGDAKAVSWTKQIGDFLLIRLHFTGNGHLSSKSKGCHHPNDSTAVSENHDRTTRNQKQLQRNTEKRKIELKAILFLTILLKT